MTDQKKKPNDFDTVFAVLSIVISAVLSVGGYLFFIDNDTWKDIFEDVSIILYVLPFGLLSIAVISIIYKKTFDNISSYVFIFLLSIIGVLSSYSTLFIIKNRDLLIDSDVYISTRVIEILNEIPTQTPAIITPTNIQSNLSTQIDTPIPTSVEKDILDFVDLVNSKIILGLSNSKKYEEDIYSYFCKSTPMAKDQVEVFYRGIMRKYCGYGVSTFTLPAKYESVAIVQEPFEINGGEYLFSQIERWEYTVYAGEKNERIDVSEKLYEYTILEIEDGLYCISNYVYEDPPEDYYLGLETQ